MTRGTATKLATSSLALALMMVSCKPGGDAHVSSAGSATPTGGHLADALAAEGARALAAGDANAAIGLSERAVAFAPKNADYRLQLGRAYLAGGRFRSAAQSFEDARALGREDGTALLDLALADAALGDAAGAHDALDAAAGRAADADRGLALALAGDTAAAIPLLETTARATGATATARQNLALAYALAGRWGESRTVAAQDIPAAELDARMAHWAEFAQASTPAVRVAGMISLPIAAEDPGLPAALALVRDHHAPVQTAAAEPMPVAEPATQSSAAATADAAPPIAAPDVPRDAPIETAAVPAPSVASATPVPPYLAPPAAVPAAPPLLRAAPRPAKVRVASAGALLRTRPQAWNHGEWVVQLGAFSSVRHAETAWTRTRSRLALSASYTPMGGTVSRGALALHRLSLTGFPTRAAAVAMCARVRHAGGECFVRAAAGDAPLQWVSRKPATQVASR